MHLNWKKKTSADDNLTSYDDLWSNISEVWSVERIVTHSFGISVAASAAFGHPARAARVSQVTREAWATQILRVHWTKLCIRLTECE